MKFKSKIIRIFSISILSFIIIGFCLITDSARVYKTYIPDDLPFFYRLNSSTPESYYDAIHKGAVVWNNVEGSYFEFQKGENTPVSFVGRDGVNLVFFDLQGVNFSDPNVIAFSMTFSSNSPRYRAVESDLVWNAKDHAPSPTGEPFFIDLQSTMAHEFGHHLGLDHTGLPGGASSGCGPLVPSATMWAFATDGDTTGRNLHPEDVIGVTVLYPNWILEGYVIDASTASPLKGATVTISDGYAARLGELNYNYWYTISGYILQDIPTNQNGFFQSPVTKPTFTAQTNYFGFYPQSMEVNFAPPSGYGNTQTIIFNASLLRTPNVNFTGKIFDEKNNIPISADIDFYWVQRPDSVLFSTSTDANGNYVKSIPSNEYYKVRMRMNLPYVNERIFDSVYVDESGFNLDLNLKPVNILYVADDPSVNTYEKYQSLLNSTGIEYAYTDNDVNPVSPEILTSFSKPLTLIWASGGSNSSGLSETEKELIKEHLRNGDYLILAGRNIVEYSVGDSLIEDYIGVTFNGNHLSPFSVRGFAGHPVGNGISFSSTIPSKDVFALTNSTIANVKKAFHYGAALSDAGKIAAITFEGKQLNYKGFLIGFGFESIGNEETATEIFYKIFDWLYDGAISNTEENILKPFTFSLSQNYPNPFNPVTTINYSIPLQEKVLLKIYDSIGREVKTLVNEVRSAGNHSIVFNAAGFSSGVYYYRLSTGNYSDTKKFILLK